MNSDLKNRLPEEGYMPSAPPSYDEVVGARQYPAVPTGTYFVPPPAVSSNVMPVVGFGQSTSGVPYTIPAATLVQQINVGPSRARITCPQCSKNIKTSTETSYQKTAHIACLLLCLFGCCPCSCIPYCLDSCKNVHHKCPECKAYIGTYKH